MHDEKRERKKENDGECGAEGRTKKSDKEENVGRDSERAREETEQEQSKTREIGVRARRSSRESQRERGEKEERENREGMRRDERQRETACSLYGPKTEERCPIAGIVTTRGLGSGGHVLPTAASATIWCTSGVGAVEGLGRVPESAKKTVKRKTGLNFEEDHREEGKM